MALLLAPYNNAMRLGQGFNSYTHEILIDDAVVVNPNREENVLTNDGNTMRLTAMIAGKPSAWTKQTQVVIDVEQIIQAQQAQKDKQAEQNSQAGADESSTPQTATSDEAPTSEGSPGETTAAADNPAADPAKEQTGEGPADEAPQGGPTDAQGQASGESQGTEKEEKLVSGLARTDGPPGEDTKADPVEKGTEELTQDAAQSEEGRSTGDPSRDASKAESQTPEPADGHASEHPFKAKSLAADESAARTDEVFDDAQGDAKGNASSTIGAEGSVKNDSTSVPKGDVQRTDKDKNQTSSVAGDAEGNPDKDSTPATEGDDQRAIKEEDQSNRSLAAIPATKAKRSATDGGTQRGTPAKQAEVKQEESNKAKQQHDAEAAALAKARDADKAAAIKQIEIARLTRQKAPEAEAAANKYKVAMTIEQMTAAHREYRKLKSSVKAAPGAGKNTQVFNILNSSGVSQTVIYKSGFVEKLSEITDDLGVSASLSIKKGSCGGGGRGSFIDTDKFNSSDLKYYVSVQVINQSINFKDALEFNPLPGVKGKDFRTLFGDCFISGFLEGGELNAVITMNILNKEKARDIVAEGSIALGKEGSGMTAQGAFKTANANLSLNSETTVNVSYIGGGCIKPPEEAWTIESLTRAATRFPDHVATSPQRTHAILTKYETLRSYRMNLPPAVTPLEYENAKLYTNELLDIFMSYKTMYSRLTTQITEVQGGILKFKKETSEKDPKKDQEAARKALREKLGLAADANLRSNVDLCKLSDAEKKTVIGLFPATLDGLDDARKATRAQMNLIVERVDEVDEDPSKVLCLPKEKFLPVFSFETLLPSLEPTSRSSKRTTPLTGQRMFTTGKEKPNAVDTTAATRMCQYDVATTKKDSDTVKARDPRTVLLLADEIVAIKEFLDLREEGVEESLRLTPPMGNEAIEAPPGQMFTALDFVQPNSRLGSVRIALLDGVICGLVCKYDNGVSWKRGNLTTNDNFTLNLPKTEPAEHITSVAITVGTEAVVNSPEFILALRLVTNQGKSVLAQWPKVRRAGYGRRFIGQRIFSNVRTVTWESPLENGFMSGFWGWSSERGSEQGIFRLGVVWSKQEMTKRVVPEDRKKATAREKDEENEDTLTEKEKLKQQVASWQRTAEEHEAERRKVAEDLAAAQAAKEEAIRQAQMEQEWLNAEIKKKEDEISSKQHIIERNEQDIAEQNNTAAELQRLLKKALDSTTNVKKADEAQMSLLYRTLGMTTGGFHWVHKSGMLMDFLLDRGKPYISNPRRGWSQTFYFQSTTASSGVEIVCKAPNNKYLGLYSDHGDLNFLGDGFLATFTFEPVSEGNEWFYIKYDGKYLGTEDQKTDALTPLVLHSENLPGPTDYWKLEKAA
ncbi:hypothetical protein OC844_005814 [Tilletia horrida]|nr:hypothetical protein OC844_005814 [Tilletia horrida]